MPYCPKCHTEYREGFTKCADCGCDLEMGSEPQDTANDHTPDTDGVELVFLTSVDSIGAAPVVESLLRQNGIPYVTRDREAGDYLRIYTGSSVFGIDIFVRKSDYKAALSLISEN